MSKSPNRHRALQTLRGTRIAYDDLVPSFDRELVTVDEECEALEHALADHDVSGVERAAYALASAWFLAEAGAMRILGASFGISARRRFLRAMIVECSGVVTARCQRALAETSTWVALDPKPVGLGRVRAVLGQLSGRVDVRERSAGRAGHCEPGGTGAPSAPVAWGAE